MYNICLGMDRFNKTISASIRPNYIYHIITKSRNKQTNYVKTNRPTGSKSTRTYNSFLVTVILNGKKLLVSIQNDNTALDRT